MEHVLQRCEQEGRAAELNIGNVHALRDAVGNSRRDNGEAGHDGNDRIRNDDDDTVLGEVFALIQIGAVGDHGAHGEGQREEHLTTCGRQNVHHTWCFFNEASLHSVAGDEHELQAFRSVRQRPCADDDDDEHDEQGGHADLVELLDAAVNAAEVNQEADEHEQHQNADADPGVAQHRAKGAAVRHRAEQAADVDADVVDAVAAEDGVEGHDKERGDNRQPADPSEALLLRDRLVSVYRAVAGLAADCQLAKHDCKANEDSQQEIDNQECEAAAFTHLVGEAPDVAEADGGTDGRQQEADITAK